MTMLYLPLFIDTPGTTAPELKGFLIGEELLQEKSLYSEILDTTPPLTSLWEGVMQSAFDRSLTARHIIAFFILLIQSAFWGIILIDKKAFSENTYIPSLLFCLLVFISFDFLSLTGELLGFGFLLLGLNNLLKEIEFRVQRDETILNLGVSISLASFFSFSYALFLPGCTLILILFTRTPLRKHLLLVFGFVLPQLILCGIYFYNNTLSSLWAHYYLPSLHFSFSSLISLKGLLILTAIPLFYLVVSLFILNREARLTKYQSQVFQTMFLWFLIAIVQLFLAGNMRPQTLLPLIPPFSFFFTHFLLLIRRRKFAEINLWVLLVGIVSVAYLARYNKINGIQYDLLLVKETPSEIKNKKILVLDENPSLFMQNTLAPACVDWLLTKELFEQPDYYENVLLVNKLFQTDPPEVIVDPKKLMEGYFVHLPELQKQYQISPEGYRLISN
jgi:hypothetical protein